MWDVWYAVWPVCNGEGRELDGRRDGQVNEQKVASRWYTQTSRYVMTMWTNCAQKMEYMGI